MWPRAVITCPTIGLLEKLFVEIVDQDIDELEHADDNLCIKEVYLQAKQMPFCFVFTPCLSMSS